MDLSPRSLGRTLADTTGQGLGLLIGGFGLAHPARKPLHPRGTVWTARLRREGHDASPLGVQLIDKPGEDHVLVRVSRAVGLPAVLPDIHGIAVRVSNDDGGHGDLLFASTGLTLPTRFLLTGSRRVSGRPLTTLLPATTAAGSIVLGLQPRDDEHFVALWARPNGPWQRWGELALGLPAGDPPMPFDPILHEVRGLTNPDWVRRVREPAYRRARASRGETTLNR